MRTIKFRGKRIDNGEWVYGSLDLTDNSAAISWDKTDNDGGTVPWFANVDPETVGQFTGLLDKNGKEIYEGDILLCKGKYLYQVEWLTDGFMIRGKTSGEITSIESFLPIQREVVGNIFDHPELLNEK